MRAGDTVFVRGTGGAIFERDVPPDGHARELFDQQLAKGDLALVAECHWVDGPEGSRFLREGAQPEGDSSDAPAKKARRAKPEGDSSDAPAKKSSKKAPEPAADASPVEGAGDGVPAASDNSGQPEG